MQPYLAKLRQAQADLRAECGRCERTVPALRSVDRCPHVKSCAVPRCLARLELALVGACHPESLDVDETRRLRHWLDGKKPG
jgi:hypothetical protein